jgi:hypothetical protein
MQYLGRISIPGDVASERHVLLFMCQNNPGGCNEWEPGGGGNLAQVVVGPITKDVAVPTTGATLRETAYSASIVSSLLEGYVAACKAWAKENGMALREVLGQIGGHPAWLQADETPSCDACNKPMRFLAQLEEGPDWRTAMNFGGCGWAYVFDCSCGNPRGKFLWQCG